MKPVYDGLKVERIQITTSDIFTGSIECISNVMNIKVGDICVSEHLGDTYCTEYEHARYNEDYTPGDTTLDDIC